MKTIELPCYGIIVTLTDEGGGGDIVSALKDLSNPHEGNGADEFNAAVDAIAFLILAHAESGMDIETPEYIHGIEEAVNKCTQYFS